MCAFKPSCGALRLHYCTTRAINASTETFSARSLWLFPPPPPRPPYRSNLSVQQQSCLITAALTHLLSSPPCHLVARGGGGLNRRGKDGQLAGCGQQRLIGQHGVCVFFNIERCIGESSGRVSASAVPPRPPGSGATVSQLHPSPGLSRDMSQPPHPSPNGMRLPVSQSGSCPRGPQATLSHHPLSRRDSDTAAVAVYTDSLRNRLRLIRSSLIGGEQMPSEP